MTHTAPNYLQPGIPAGLRHAHMPVVPATAENLKGYGRLVGANEYEAFEIEIVRWPASGWRPVDEDSGNEGGTTAGIFTSQWKGDVLYGVNEAVGGHYVLGYAVAPELANEEHENDPDRILMWHANYHPDGGQIFFYCKPNLFMSPWLCRAITSVQRILSASNSPASRACTFTPTFGMTVSLPDAVNNDSLTARVRFTHASPSTSRASSNAWWPQI
jgi:hypothetical protein